MADMPADIPQGLNWQEAFAWASNFYDVIPDNVWRALNALRAAEVAEGVLARARGVAA